jgi:hypothetical protein
MGQNRETCELGKAIRKCGGYEPEKLILLGGCKTALKLFKETANTVQKLQQSI